MSTRNAYFFGVGLLIGIAMGSLAAYRGAMEGVDQAFMAWHRMHSEKESFK